MSNSYKLIETVQNLPPEKFFKNYVGKKPVVIKGLIQDWPAIKKWNSHYLKKNGGNIDVSVKVGNPRNKEYITIKFGDYVDYISSLTSEEKQKMDYCLHDTLLIDAIPNFRNDIKPFISEYLPKWYTYKWWKYLLFFYGKKGFITPFHFDILGAHNLFFHLKGKKRFIIIHPQKIKYCYMVGYNHSNIDPDNLDHLQYPLFNQAEPQQIILEPGDVLYMPPYTMHHVTSLTNCISMNIDWHTKESVAAALIHSLKNKKFKIFWLNILCMLGLIFNIKSKYIYPLYKHYFKIL